MSYNNLTYFSDYEFGGSREKGNGEIKHDGEFGTSSVKVMCAF